MHVLVAVLLQRQLAGMAVMIETKAWFSALWLSPADNIDSFSEGIQGVDSMAGCQQVG